MNQELKKIVISLLAHLIQLINSCPTAIVHVTLSNLILFFIHGKLIYWLPNFENHQTWLIIQRFINLFKTTLIKLLHSQA